MTIIAPVLTCGPTRQRCTEDMTWLERVTAIGWDVADNGCWEWRGSRVGKWRRARVASQKGRHYAYRVTYEAVNGPIPEGMMACHLCDNPGCVNPAHILPGTGVDNARMISRDRRSNAIPVDTCDSIRLLYATGRISQRQLARAFDVSLSTVARLVGPGSIAEDGPCLVSTRTPEFKAWCELPGNHQEDHMDLMRSYSWPKEGSPS